MSNVEVAPCEACSTQLPATPGLSSVAVFTTTLAAKLAVTVSLEFIVMVVSGEFGLATASGLDVQPRKVYPALGVAWRVTVAPAGWLLEDRFTVPPAVGLAEMVSRTSTVRVKVCSAVPPTPLLALNVMGKVPVWLGIPV